jgi:hypothetical protein
MKLFFLLFSIGNLSVTEGLSLESRSVTLPLTQEYTIATKGLLHQAFHEIVDGSDFLERDTESVHASCSVPAFGEDVHVLLQPADDGSSSSSASIATATTTTTITEQPPSEFVLTVEQANARDFGWICAKFYESREHFGETCNFENLRVVVTDHFNSEPPQPGDNANTVDWAELPRVQELLQSDPSILTTLQDVGYVTIDSAPEITADQNNKLTKFLVEKTNQSPDIRTDTVHFLDQDEAYACDLQEHYDMLMSIASYLNDNAELRDSSHKPLLPATRSKPLTIVPGRRIQLAEYGENEFYVPHSDNSLHGQTRSNFRHYTCILYCNQGWTPEMGGALRIYPGSREYATPDDAKAELTGVDINPVNGRLLIFDSCLIHSVEPVAQSQHLRRALTLWINRPDDSGVRGEAWF